MSRPIPATNESAGPFRKVVGTKPTTPDYAGTPRIAEILECGHRGKTLRDFPWASAIEQVKTRRRCWPCQYEANQQTKP